MIQGKWISPDSDEYFVAKDIMVTVFDENLKDNEAYLHEELNPMANHVIVYDNDTHEIAGYGRITYDLDDFVIDNICILSPYRGRYYGDFVARMLVDKGIQCGAEAIYAVVPDSLKNFLSPIGFKEADTPLPGYAHMYEGHTLMHLIPAEFKTKCQCH